MLRHSLGNFCRLGVPTSRLPMSAMYHGQASYTDYWCLRLWWLATRRIFTKLVSNVILLSVTIFGFTPAQINAKYWIYVYRLKRTKQHESGRFVYRSRLVFGRYQAEISAGLPPVLITALCHFPQSLKNAEMIYLRTVLAAREVLNDWGRRTTPGPNHEHAAKPAENSIVTMVL
jgi:hypothetical protein